MKMWHTSIDSSSEHLLVDNLNETREWNYTSGKKKPKGEKNNILQYSSADEQ